MAARTQAASQPFRMQAGRQLNARPATIFPCSGAGEFSVSDPKYADLLTAAVEEAAGGILVIVKGGYGRGQASRFAAIAEAAGADPAHEVDGKAASAAADARSTTSMERETHGGSR